MQQRWQWPRYPYQVEELPHTSEVGLEVRAASGAGVYAGLARAMFALIGTHPPPRPRFTRRPVTLSAPDAEALLVDWLSELLYLHAVTGLIFPRCAIHVWTPTRLEAVVGGCRPARRPILDIKAVTYHDIRVAQEGEGWLGRVYFDI